VIAAAVALFGLVRKAPGQSALVAMGLAVALGLTYGWGLSNGKQSAVDKVASAELQKAQQANEKLQERIREGERASNALRDELDQRNSQIDTLKWSLRNVPKLVSTQACPAPGDVRLSVAAVRLYDLALAGDGGELSGRPGRADAQDATASAAAGGDDGRASGVTVSVFQDVSQVNAERFGECWTRLARLQEFLDKRAAAGAR